MTKPYTMLGADKEADAVLDRLTTVRKGPLNARVHIDVAGRLCILIDGGGLLSINERDLTKVHGDELFEL